MKNISLISNQKVRRHLANNSPAKITHAFPKSRRFYQQNPECKEAFYNSTTSLSKRHSGIGFGIKSDFTKNSIVSPAASTYKMSSQFEKLDKKFSFRIGRQKSPQRNYLYHVTKAKVPGPGTNQVKTRMTISFTNRPRTLDVNKKKLSFLQSPGPGKYQSLQMSPSNGKTKLSKNRTVKLSIINKDIRFKDIKPVSPSPNHYNHIDNFSPSSKYYLSQHSGQGTRPFDHENKFTHRYWKQWADNHNPAPVKYDKPSDFGVYGDYNYYKTLNLKD